MVSFLLFAAMLDISDCLRTTLRTLVESVNVKLQLCGERAFWCTRASLILYRHCTSCFLRLLSYYDLAHCNCIVAYSK